ncbi:MAG: hypothetical protein H5T49_06145 [Hadesarchaea archaeon]|nr:hypothetical protein [Hadesarchaea archaeon]
MEKEKLLERLNEALIKTETDVKLIVRSILEKSEDEKIKKELNKLLEENDKHAETLKQLTKYVLSQGDKNEF